MSDQEKRVDGTELVPDAFELLLARAMSRVDAPEGFAERVVGRVASAEGGVAGPAQVSDARPFGRLRAGSGAPGVLVIPKRSGWLRMQAWVGGAIAAALALGMFGAEQLHQRRERAEQAAIATQQFEAAVRVTDRALAQTREQLQRAGLNLGQ